jgi:hypothetical protein
MDSHTEKKDEEWELTSWGAVRRLPKRTKAKMTARGAVETPKDGTKADMTAHGAEQVPEDAHKSTMTGSGAVVDKAAGRDPEGEDAKPP